MASYLVLLCLTAASCAVKLTSVPPEIISKISSYLSFPRQVQTRRISQNFNLKFNELYSPIMHTIKSIMQAPDSTNQSHSNLIPIFDQQLSNFNELFYMKLPEILAMKRLNHTAFRDKFHTPVTTQQLEFWKDEPFQVQALQLASVYIVYLKDGCVGNDIWKAVYAFSYQFARKRNPLLPEINDLFYLSHNENSEIKQKQLEYVRYLQQKVGVHFWHPQIKDEPWCYACIGVYMEQVIKIHEYLSEELGFESTVESQYFFRGWVYTVLSQLLNGSHYDLMHYLHHPDVPRVIVNTVICLAKDGYFDALERFLFQIKNNNGLLLLSHGDAPALTFLIAVLGEKNQIRLFDILIRVCMRHTMDEYVIHTLSVSLSWWLQGQRHSPMVMLDQLASDRYFDTSYSLFFEMLNIHCAYTFSENQDEFFKSAFQRLQRLRNDWLHSHWSDSFIDKVLTKQLNFLI
eukprot:276677_1